MRRTAITVLVLALGAGLGIPLALGAGPGAGFAAVIGRAGAPGPQAGAGGAAPGGGAMAAAVGHALTGDSVALDLEAVHAERVVAFEAAVYHRDQVDLSDLQAAAIAQPQAAVAAAAAAAAQQAAQEQAAAQAQAAADAAEAAAAPPTGQGELGGVWLELRECESGDDYQEDTGNGFYGAYQFELSTWQELGYSGYPNDAPPAVQDQAAERLQAMDGWEPWPACSAELGL